MEQIQGINLVDSLSISSITPKIFKELTPEQQQKINIMYNKNISPELISFVMNDINKETIEKYINFQQLKYEQEKSNFLQVVHSDPNSPLSLHINDKLKPLKTVLRKMVSQAQFSASYSQYDIKSSVEKVLDILTYIKNQMQNPFYQKDLDWCIEQISQNKLHQVDNEDLLKQSQNSINNNSDDVQDVIETFSSPRSPRKTIRSKRNSSLITNYKYSIFSLEQKKFPEKYVEHFENVNSLSFNCFQANEIMKGNLVIYLIQHLFDKHDLFSKLNIDPLRLSLFADYIQNGYLNNPYHNKIHAADVCQTINFFCTTGKFIQLSDINEVEIAALLLGGICHDFEHPGFTSTYLIETKHQFAIKYNDKSPLENHHVSAAFQIMQDEKYNILNNFDVEDYKRFRQLMIELILSTDMANHFSELAKLKARIPSENFDLNKQDKDLIMCAIMHASDVSNPTKPFVVYSQWTDRVLSEFWNQGDQERNKGLKISYLCDRYSVNVSKSQIGFIDFIVKPLWEVLTLVMPDIKEAISNLEDNKKNYEELITKYEEELQNRKSEFEKIKTIQVKEEEIINNKIEKQQIQQ